MPRPSPGSLTTTQVLFFCALGTLIAQLYRGQPSQSAYSEAPPQPPTVVYQPPTADAPTLEQILSDFREDQSSAFLAELQRRLKQENHATAAALEVARAATAAATAASVAPPDANLAMPTRKAASPERVAEQPADDFDMKDFEPNPVMPDALSGSVSSPMVATLPAAAASAPAAFEQVPAMNAEGTAGAAGAAGAAGTTGAADGATTRRQRMAASLAEQRRAEAHRAALLMHGDGESGADAVLLAAPEGVPRGSDVLVFAHVPKTGGGSFYDTLRFFTARRRGLQWYPGHTGGSASFTDTGCGVASGSAHCDLSEIDACLATSYTGKVPALVPGGRRLFVTVLRQPVRWGDRARVCVRACVLCYTHCRQLAFAAALVASRGRILASGAARRV